MNSDLSQQLIAFQDRLFAYILSQVHDFARAEDIRQQVNLVICQKFDQFEPGTEFAAWACGIARNKVLAYRRDQARDRLVLDDDLVSDLARHGIEGMQKIDRRREALLECLSSLPRREQDLLQRYYGADLPIVEVAKQLGKSKSSITSSLFRLRRSLLSCIRRKVPAGDVR